MKRARAVGIRPLVNVKPSSHIMIIWSGWGILIPIIAILGGVLGYGVGEALGIEAYGPGLGLGLAAFANWAIWRAIDRKGARVLWDPAAGREVHLKPKHSLFFIPGRFWTVLIGMLAVVMIVGGVEGAKKDAANAKLPGFKEFTAANELIGSARNGEIHGNTDEAKAAAREFSSGLKQMVSTLFSGNKKPSDGEYLTYCNETPDAITILCHVPSLRKFKSDDAKDGLSQIAWEVAYRAVTTLDPEHQKSLTVGLRGIVSYGVIQQGKAGEETPSTRQEGEEAMLYPVFTPES